uniref:Uncharacterized protein n=1 Tax=Lepeophtheirus salmonis TaxID=72036 RepID=A0A0K2UCL6_LEPSM
MHCQMYNVYRNACTVKLVFSAQVSKLKKQPLIADGLLSQVFNFVNKIRVRVGKNEMVSRKI